MARVPKAIRWHDVLGWQRLAAASSLRQLPLQPVAPFELAGCRRASSLAAAAILTSVLGCFCGAQLLGRRRVAVRSSRIELLVDADQSSIEDIRQAIRRLKVEGPGKIRTTIFAAPGRIENKKWCRFLREPGIKLQPVPRASSTATAEPNDDAIVSAMRKLAKVEQVHHIALLTADKDFKSTCLDLQADGTSIVLLVPERKYGVVRQYQDTGLEVLRLKNDRDTRSRVRAILHDHGGGSVQLTDAIKTFDNKEGGQAVGEFLTDLGYSSDTDWMIQASAKFWYANQLGSLTVFPQQQATVAVQHAMQSGVSQTWERYCGSLAFFLPSSGLRSAKKVSNKFGNGRAYGVFQGGGPFILEDSPNLTADALRKLGYLDDDLNADLTEAMFCFINASDNKWTLRKTGFLPCTGDRSCNVSDNLRLAFLSNATRGRTHG